MNRQRVNNDFRILDVEQRRLRGAGGSVWSRHTWRPLSDSSFELFLFDYVLPAEARPRTTHLKIEGRNNLYDPIGNGRYYFYRNIWLADRVKVRRPGTRTYGDLPRVFSDPDHDGWHFWCVHPGDVGVRENVLSFLRIVDLFVKNADPNVW